ncbi:hypothetical protein PV08_07205 [Exophiala spinifera]|uniref:Protein kinase domain-containing protein n=1 Tax=Exophiala spinifera TaxID=91928 RepID=A0A0D1ZNL0_9EURO|nr:uncharacterized protein PV08_07205 [Exophiala spinifera]KIW14422.1 hypothetical protein PV08_07205 [Exophiala spinifera]
MESPDRDHKTFMSAMRCLGTGPSGHVFAIDAHNIMKVTLETAPEYVGDEARRRLQLEKKIYERLGNHDRICEFKYAVDHGHVLEGFMQNLSGLLRLYAQAGRQPPLPLALKWSIQTADACAYIHSKGVIKANLNCHTLFMDNQGNIKLYDFTGSSIDGSMPLERPDPGFVRPGADATRADVQDNLFALGSIMYQITTGVEPSWNSNHSAPHHFHELSRLPLASVITKCWLGQYRSAAEVVKELNEVQDAEISLPKQCPASHVTGTPC